MTDCITVPVGLGDRAYDVVIGAGALEACADRLASLFPRKRAVVITDDNIADLHLDRVQAWLNSAGIECQPVIVEPGETSKSFNGLQTVVDALLDRNIERSENIIALGGGVVGDLTGFAAAITKRGTGFIQIPTTLLAQVDSSVGGKTGINTRHGKNFVGAFHQPGLVIADTLFLESLPDREVRAGYAEILKAALIGDAGMFDRLETAGKSALDGAGLTRAIADAVAFKARIVEEDEREAGRRALLNLGHTFGHALEAEAPKDAIRHGEAVAVGCALALGYSVEKGHADASDAERLRAHLREIGLPATPGELAHSDWNAEALLARMRDDKKNRDGRITLILTRGIGNAYIDDTTDETDLVRFMETTL